MKTKTLLESLTDLCRDILPSALFVGLLAFALLVCPSAHAQKAGLYNLLSGGYSPAATTNVYRITGVSTNTYGNPGTATNLILNVSEFNSAGLTYTITGNADTTNVSLRVYKSFDKGATFEANPSFSYLNINVGAATYTTNASITLTDVTHIAFVFGNIGTAVATNSLSINLKSPKYGAKAATQ